MIPGSKLHRELRHKPLWPAELPLSLTHQGRRDQPRRGQRRGPGVQEQSGLRKLVAQPLPLVGMHGLSTGTGTRPATRPPKRGSPGAHAHPKPEPPAPLRGCLNPKFMTAGWGLFQSADPSQLRAGAGQPWARPCLLGSRLWNSTCLARSP